jgi:hypothetical protein
MSLPRRRDHAEHVGPAPVRLPPSLIAACIRTAEREGVTRTRMLALMVEYALDTMPPAGDPDPVTQRNNALIRGKAAPLR